MFTYSQAGIFIGNHKRRKLCNNTYIEHIGNGCIGIKLHNTYVVKMYPNDDYELNTGGFRTKVTMNRMNKYSPANVYQKDYEWYVVSTNTPQGQTFFDGMKVR